MVSGIPGDEKVQHDAGRRTKKFAFKHMFPQALRGFRTPSRRHEHTGRPADSCSEDERPGAGSDFYIPSY